MSDKNIIVLPKETYQKMVENSKGTKMFNSLFVQVKETGIVQDILQDGMYSCAFFVSTVLAMFRLIDEPYTTVKSLREKVAQDKKKFYQVSQSECGDIIFWEEITFEDGSKNEHAGFALNAEEAMSTSFREKQVSKHHITFGEDENGDPKRKIVGIYRVKFEDYE